MWHLFLFNLQIYTWNLMRNARGTWPERQAALLQPRCEDGPLGGTGHRGLFPALRDVRFYARQSLVRTAGKKGENAHFLIDVSTMQMQKVDGINPVWQMAVLKRGPHTLNPKTNRNAYCEGSGVPCLTLPYVQHFLLSNHILHTWASWGELDKITSRSLFQSKLQDSHFTWARRVPI